MQSLKSQVHLNRQCRIAPSGRRSPLRLAARGPVRLDPGARRARDVASHRRFGLQNRGRFSPRLALAVAWQTAGCCGRAVGCVWATRKGCSSAASWSVPKVVRVDHVHSLAEAVRMRVQGKRTEHAVYLPVSCPDIAVIVQSGCSERALRVQQKCSKVP
ncbi:hypothetical membrane associated protein [Cupriavidus necator H16]|uniref:Hypothetical membrane associated protein n=1 Tax=Cupriavidus necator (strain ATCC 17699 / DSM 428 / KCTC 22496 / NCIMB 10442 / H16 / Stanier 337) TaxID=381666 RepID=Q0K8V0_CUPNH|nr:hypothetical membrane associated protein [Cupriavidus necator H16]